LIKAILFDFGGTLDADGQAWKERFHAAYRDQGLDLDAAAFARRYYAADDPLIGAIPRTTGFDDTVGRLVANLEAGLGGADPERGRRVADRFIADSRAALARAATALVGLARRHEIGVVSNFYGNLDAVCRDTGIAPYLSVAVDSAILGEEKPSPGIFRAAIEALGVRAGDCVYVGDSLRRDRTGARNIGMPFIWVASPKARRQAGLAPDDRYPDDWNPDDRVVASVAEVEGLLA